MAENKVEEIVINEPAPAPEPEKIDVSTLPLEEQELAKKHELIPKEELGADGKVKKEEKKVEDKKIDDENLSFEDVEKNEKEHLGKFTKREQGVYFRWKHDKKLRQEAQAERDLKIVSEKALKSELQKAKDEGGLTQAKLAKVNELLAGPADEITVENIQAILKAEAKKVEEDENKPLTKKDLEDLQKANDEKLKNATEANKQFVKRMNELEEYGKNTYDNYDEIIESCKEVFEGKVELGVINADDLAARYIKKVNDPDVSEQDIADFIIGVAKLNPNYTGKKVKDDKVDANKNGKVEKKVTDAEIDKIVKNAGKGQSSVKSGGNGRRVVTPETITVEDAQHLTVEQWRALPEGTRKRLLS